MMKAIIRKKKQKNKAIALERILSLFDMAEKIFSDDPILSHRYVEIARKLQMKYELRMPRDLRRRFCKHCLHYLVPSKNLRVRLQKDHIVYYCLDCKKFMRYVHKPKQRDRKVKEDSSDSDLGNKADNN